MRKINWPVGLLLVAMLASGVRAHGQVSLYGEGTADYLKGGPDTNFLYGATTGVLIDGPQLIHNKLLVSADFQGNFVYESGAGGTYLAAGEQYDAITLGPRFTLVRTFFKLQPYAQFNVGFARYHDPTIHSTTDSVYGVQGGVTRRLTPRFDALVDYSYSQFGYDSNYYNPQTISAGLVYHFVKR